MNWRSDNQDYLTDFDMLKVGETFFFDDDPYIKISVNEGFDIESNSICIFQANDPIEPCTHELILRI